MPHTRRQAKNVPSRSLGGIIQKESAPAVPALGNGLKVTFVPPIVDRHNALRPRIPISPYVASIVWDSRFGECGSDSESDLELVSDCSPRDDDIGNDEDDGSYNTLTVSPRCAGATNACTVGPV